jgi:hypothetical protein
VTFLKKANNRCNDLLILEVIDEMHMRNFLIFIASFFSLIQGMSCKKDEKTDSCFSGSPTVRQIVNQQATIKVTGTILGVYMVEQGSIDTKLIPCNLPQEFLQNDLQVIISGEVKSTPPGTGPCCSNNFVITSISR